MPLYMSNRNFAKKIVNFAQQNVLNYDLTYYFLLICHFCYFAV